MNSLSPSSSTSARWDARLWGALIVLCGVVFLDALDVSMVGVALPSIRKDLGLSTSELQWVVSGYVLAYGGLLLLGGRTADLLGRKRTLLIALSGFTGVDDPYEPPRRPDVRVSGETVDEAVAKVLAALGRD